MREQPFGKDLLELIGRRITGLRVDDGELMMEFGPYDLPINGAFINTCAAMLLRINKQAEARERGELARLKAKYE